MARAQRGGSTWRSSGSSSSSSFAASGNSHGNRFGAGGKRERGSTWSRNSQGARANRRANASSRGITDAKLLALKKGDELDAKFGFELLNADSFAQDQELHHHQQEIEPRLGWLLNIRTCAIPDPIELKTEVSCVELYFLEQDGRAFKTRVVYQPYFYVRAAEGRWQEVIAYCMRKFEGILARADRVLKEDLDLPNHLSGKKAVYIKLSFHNVADLMSVKQELLPLIHRNQAQQRARLAYEGQTAQAIGGGNGVGDDDGAAMDAFGGNHRGQFDESESALIDMREYDVPYSMRVAIDLDIRVGSWYHVKFDPTAPFLPSDITRQVDMVDKAEPVVCAFDIECTKAPLKFPDAQVDQIYMISYMIDRQGYLIVNREYVSQEIADFEYTPKEDYPGPFIVFNEDNEEQLIRRFFEHVIEAQPHIFVTYNGDFFDWPFVEARAKVYDINMADEIGISLDQRTGEYRGRCSVHMDAFCWVKRDSYLPQGSQGLKAVTKYKLGYDPVEVDAEDMVTLAREEPHKMASYSVSDAVATFYLYDKYVHLFVFSLCTIIPLGCEDVLRKGSGTLCEALLMVEAFKGNIICPNKQSSAFQEKFYKGHLVEAETYVGGHVECLESGVFRADFEYQFNLVPSAFDGLIQKIDRDLEFALEVEMNVPMDQVENYDQVKQQIVDKLRALAKEPKRMEKPLIYHLDVAAMYPNIILTNRLQPCAIVTEADCASCVFNTECGRVATNSASQSCQRSMEWMWRGDFYPTTKPEYLSLKTQLEYENFPNESNELVPFAQLRESRKTEIIKQRLKTYCQSVYKKVKSTEEEKRQATVCMRENSFYVNTVRAFRDRRYEYKTLTKVWKGKQAEAGKKDDLLAKIEAQNKCLVYDSLQLAHKCILNSFYGYVMRKGARWHSMEMAGIVTNTGANIITGARELVEQIGRPLELDTDGIWCMLPGSFPETFSFQLKGGGKKTISYPCVMLNADVNDKFTNHQYHELLEDGTYRVHSECSILFEVDGPYKCMVLPASTEEGRLLKKRYAVFNFDNSLAELKGFELKRRGELQLIKAFQSQVFECFLDGTNLDQCYASVAKCANRWLDILDTKGRDVDDEELMELLTENKSMSGKLEEYAGQKSTSITTAKRLSEFLGDSMIKDKGLTCRMIIAARPYGEKVTERAIPTAIFAAEEAVKRYFLKKWLRDANMQTFDLRQILDWDYYRTRFASTIQKIICLPAAFQNVSNPVPRVELPDWMRKQVRDRQASKQQGSIMKQFQVVEKPKDVVAALIEIEDLAGKSDKSALAKRSRRLPTSRTNTDAASDMENESPSPNDQDTTTIDPMEADAKKVSLGEVEFSEWIHNRRQQWRALNLRRKRLREEKRRAALGADSNSDNLGLRRAKRHQSGAASGAGSSSLVASGGLGMIGMENFLMNASNALRQDYWQLLEIQQDSHNGIFQVWVLTSASKMLHRIQLRIPRTFFINCVEENLLLSELDLGSSPARRVMRILPHQQQVFNLFQVELSEGQFQRNRKDVVEILGDPSFKGVFELNVKSHTRAVCALGCVARVVGRAATSKITSSDVFDLNDLQSQSSNECPYLLESDSTPQATASMNNSLRRVLLYYTAQKRRGLLALITLDEEDVNDATVDCVAQMWFIDPVSTVKPRKADLTKAFDELQRETHATQDFETRIRRCEFKPRVVKTHEEAFTGVNVALGHIASKKNAQRPAIILAQTCIGSSKRLREKIQGLHAFPMAMLPWNAEDQVFTALTWRQETGERLIVRMLQMEKYYQELVECGQYAHLPLGNFTGDRSICILDVLYSRLLAKHKHLWWHSPSSLPDLGGIEEEESQIGDEAMHAGAGVMTTASSASSHGQVELTDSRSGATALATQRFTDTSVHVSQPGSYVDICVELELDGLAVNAMLVAPQIHSIEGFSHQQELGFEDATTSGSTTTPAIQSTSCQEAFRLLRALVASLFKDFLATRNRFADHLLQHFYRWVCCTSSLSFDPLLKEMVKKMMQKLFLQLLVEFRQLGMQVVYADFGRLMLSTQRKTLVQAQTHLKFVLQTILSNQLFQVLSFTPKRFFSNLFFLDIENYGGIMEEHTAQLQAHWNQTDQDQDHDMMDPVTKSKSQRGEIISHWNIANYLPRGIDDYFVILVGQFIRRRAEYQARHQEADDILQDDEVLDEDGHEESQGESTRLARFSQRLIASYFTDKLLLIIPEIMSYNMGAESFPRFAGSHLLTLRNPALELVKHLCQVLELEPSVRQSVQVLKRTLLKLLRVSEFSDDAKFLNPSLSFVLEDVICLQCNLCRAVDLCRDPQVFTHRQSMQQQQQQQELNQDDQAEDDEEASTVVGWHCPRCLALYDRNELELRLVELVQQQSIAYQLQDVYCDKCHLPSEHKLRNQCACSGEFRLPVARIRSMQQTLRVLKQIAHQQGFEWLLETVQRLQLEVQ